MNFWIWVRTTPRSPKNKRIFPICFAVKGTFRKATRLLTMRMGPNPLNVRRRENEE
jgi:hypothetical protein